jgi:phosphoglycerol geranylgeranyltransferase
LIVGGGIRDPETARSIAGAGADIIVTGTVVEENDDVEYVLREIVMALKGKGRAHHF